MSTDHPRPLTPEAGPLFSCLPRTPLGLQNGDEMSGEEFMRIYEESEEDFKAELIEGVVYVASPLRASHGQPHVLLSGLLATYQAETPGVAVGDNISVTLNSNCVVQPDLLVRILPEFGGTSRINRDDYIEGPPELTIEVALTSHALDLHGKRRQYARFGVREYIVYCVQEQEVHWFNLAANSQLQPDPTGIIRIGILPGLWIDGPALVAEDYKRLISTLEKGLASDEHAAFVRELAGRKKSG